MTSGDIEAEAMSKADLGCTGNRQRGARCGEMRLERGRGASAERNSTKTFRSATSPLIPSTRR